MKFRIKHLLALVCAAALPACALAEPMISADPTAYAGVDMLAVDHRLYELGYRDGACNGVLDEITTNALRNFQTANNLEANGEPNELTVAILLGENAVSQSQYLNLLAQENALNATLADGSYGENVEKLQNKLRELGYFTGACDGVYGDETAAAVCRFQLVNGLNETGIADSTLFVRLYEDNPMPWEAFLRLSAVSVGDSGTAVRRLQLWLKQKGYFSGECTGRYGDGTQRAVKRFQADQGIEATGDMDADTCNRLYWDVSAYLRSSASLRRGDTGAEVEDFCRSLALLGYPAHARFNMQTELALMQFQLANKLKVTGVADELTMVRLRSENAVSLEDYVYPADPLPDDEGLQSRIVRQAVGLLGQYSELDTCFGFVQYVSLLCGVELMDQSQLSYISTGAADTIQPGSMLSVQVGEREICGIAYSDRAMIYRGDNGYIVIGYLEEMQADSVSLCQVIESI